MIISRAVLHVPAVAVSASLLVVVLVFAPLASASAWQAQPPRASRPTLIAPPPGVQFQQTVQQQQTRDQLQNSQLQQQLHQHVADTAKRPSANNPQLQQQLDQADRDQRDRDRASQQAQLQRAEDAARLPQPQPATASSSHRGS
ncbi:MAG TPA: hypothetical protein VN043_00135 [Rhodanobacter sp.]|nr:hypothetical protein [Rhodanobacter sp.]